MKTILLPSFSGLVVKADVEERYCGLPLVQNPSAGDEDEDGVRVIENNKKSPTHMCINTPTPQQQHSTHIQTPLIFTRSFSVLLSLRPTSVLGKGVMFNYLRL